MKDGLQMSELGLLIGSKHELCCFLMLSLGCCLCISDEKTIATAASQLKIFNCSDHKKIQKFAGHPVSANLIFILLSFTPLMLFRT